MCDITDISEEEYRTVYAQMGDARRAVIDRLKNSKNKAQSIAGDLLARTAVSEKCGIAGEKIHFGYNKNGKPFTVNCKAEFSISHSENIVVCAIGDNPIGIDVERVRPINLKIVKRICVCREAEYIFGHVPTEHDYMTLADKELLCRFFKIWTAKEAYFKSREMSVSECFSADTLCLEKKVFTLPDNDYIITVI